MSENDFGRYLASVEERDIDLLLMEEFQISDEFVAWFCGNLNLQGVRPAGAWHSVSDTDGESDLLLRVSIGNRRVGVLIENKINAPEQDQQAERYHIRGIRSREAGKFDDYLQPAPAPGGAGVHPQTRKSARTARRQGPVIRVSTKKFVSDGAYRDTTSVLPVLISIAKADGYGSRSWRTKSKNRPSAAFCSRVGIGLAVR